MKWKIFFINLVLSAIILFSCKQENNIVSPIASMNIINASPDNQQIVAAFSDTMVPFYNTSDIAYGSYQQYGNPQGNVPLILISSADTSLPAFQAKFDLKAGEIYSLFLAGQSKTLDTVFTRDFIPLYSDSVSGVRFINLSPASLPISVNVEGNDPTQTEFQGLSYRNITDFKIYPITGAVSGYNFEIRDQASGTLLTTFYWSGTLHKNNTLVISGSEDPTSPYPIQVFQVNHY